MTIYTDLNEYAYELECLSMMFLSGEKVQVLPGEPVCEGNWMTVRLCRDGSQPRFAVCAAVRGRRLEESCAVPDPARSHPKACEYSLGRLVYTILSRLTGQTPAWGILTGIRPVKLFCQRLEAGESEEEIRSFFARETLMTPRKIELALATARLEGKIISASRREDYSLYVSIPFCPTRCRYCSFVSHSIEKAGALMPDYVRLLCQELEVISRIALEQGLQLRTIYIGGGTPTTLTAPLLRTLTDTIRAHFPVEQAMEYTVEAGRPDTIDREKLEILHEAGVTRLSINPQTMQQPVLDAIGRRHTVQQVYDAFALARACGHENINMDLIAGLEQDSCAGFSDTLRQILSLAPENVTVHTLSVKRAADYRWEKEDILGEQSASRMVDEAQQALMGAGYAPYYLYRQKNMVENLENTGYCKPGYEGYYNVYIMDETHTIAAAGAGAVTKLREPGGGRIERVFNYKFPYEYIRGFREILARKEKIADFYRRYPL